MARSDPHCNTPLNVSKRKGKRRSDALRVAEDRVKECQQRLELAKLGGKQAEIDSKTEKLRIALAQEAHLRHKAKRKQYHQ